ncbi:MAG: hypothetical protein OWV35_10965 [Firmicutes bacterium]|nr:hypothetical protein [Bacillota bacterium]
MYLALLETSGNQAYIFAGNRLREAVGASYLVYAAGAEWPLEAAAAINTNHTGCLTQGKDRWAACREAWACPIEKDPSIRLEVLVAASGKALALARRAEDAEEWIARVTGQALRQAAGLEVTGVVSPCFDWDRQPLWEIERQLFQRLPAIRGARPGPLSRHQRLPVVAECESLGGPAAYRVLEKHEDGEPRVRLLSPEAYAKDKVRALGQQRLRQLNPRLSDLDGLESRMKDRHQVQWVALVHADGNRFGALFANLAQTLELKDPSRNRDYANALREFSRALDDAAVEAFQSMLREGRDTGEYLLPVIVAGDDVTFYLPAHGALQQVERFLQAYRDYTGSHPEFARWSKRPHLTMSAGVAVVKPHFPFYLAYGLAEALAASAKTGAGADDPDLPSCLDFHVLHDPGGRDLEAVRTRLEVHSLGEPARLWGGPYIVDGPGEAARFRWDRLKAMVEHLNSVDDNGDYRFPRRQAHWLREGLFQGRKEADRRLGLLAGRYDIGPLAVSKLPDGSPSLFGSVADGNGPVRTPFRDALEASAIWGEG